MKKPSKGSHDVFVEELLQQPQGAELEALHRQLLETGKELRSMREETSEEAEAEAFFRHLQRERNKRTRPTRRWLPALSLAAAGIATCFALLFSNTLPHKGSSGTGTTTASKKMSSAQIASIVLESFGLGEPGVQAAQQDALASSSPTIDTTPGDWSTGDPDDPAPIPQTLPDPLDELVVDD